MVTVRLQLKTLLPCILHLTPAIDRGNPKDFQATLVRRVTAATAAITLAFLFVEMLCYVL